MEAPKASIFVVLLNNGNSNNNRKKNAWNVTLIGNTPKR